MRTSELEPMLQFMLKNGMNVLIKGSPGIGKTDLMEQACDKLGYDLVVGHPVVDDPIDYKGLPFEIDGHAEFLPIGNLRKLIYADKPTVFFLDDLGQAAPAVQAAAMQLLLARKINEHKVSDHVTFAAATNRKEDKAGVSGILEPVKSRFASIVDLEVHVDDWSDWAAANGMPPELIGFINFRPDLLSNFKPTGDITNSPSPRTVANIGKMMLKGIPEQVRFEAFAGAAGEGFATEFTAFLDTYINLPNPKDVLKDPSKHGLDKIDDVATLYALSVALSEHVDENTVNGFFEAIDYFDTEYGMLAIKIAKRRHEDLLMQSPKFSDWVVKNNDIIF